MTVESPLIIGATPLSLESVRAVAERRVTRVVVAEEAVRLTEASRRALLSRLGENGVIYGVTTGFGDSCETPVEGDLVDELPHNLVRFHGCGVGEDFSPEETRAIVLARLASLCRGYSAVRGDVLLRLAELLSLDMLPCIPTLGSVGASGDLTPLSYVAAALIGERDVVLDGVRMGAPSAHERTGLAPLRLDPKESLALMNGTSAMTGVAALCVPRALRLARWAARLTASASNVLMGQPRHFDARIFEAKPHPGQALCAAWIRADLDFDRRRDAEAVRVQDRYSLRCAPHVIGVLLDVLPTIVRLVEVELNGANDNPLIDPETGDILHGGNFYGGHICSAMDTLKTQVANIADLMDRQLALLCNTTTNHGLPANLVGAPEARRSAHHGFKAMQISTSALAAEAAKLSMPASVFSRSTENHNQDKVSMGTIAARDCARVLDLTETIASILSLACAQAVDLRGKAGCPGGVLEFLDSVRAVSPLVEEDRALRPDIDAVLSLIQADKLALGAYDLGEIRRLG